MANADIRVIRNAAFRLHYLMRTFTTGQLLSGDAANHDVEIMDSAGTGFTDASGSETEIGSTGVYFVDLTAAEMTRAGAIQILVKSSTANTDEQLITLEAEPCLISGVAAAAASQTLTLDSNAVATDRYYEGADIEIVRGTGLGQSRQIVRYTSSRVATVDRAWATTPSTDSVYKVTPSDRPRLGLHSGTAAAGASTTITLQSDAVATADYYNGRPIEIVAGTGIGQVRTIKDYTTGRVATVDRAWSTNPDTTSIYVIHPTVVANQTTDGYSDVNLYSVGDSTTAVTIMELLYGGGAISGTVDDASATTTSFDGDSALSATNDFYNDSYLVFVSGTLAGLGRPISDYVGSTKTFTFSTAFPSAPANGSAFLILGCSS